ncbi:hypothetical protein Tco_0509252 [Tanacetum coccineum]
MQKKYNHDNGISLGASEALHGIFMKKRSQDQVIDIIMSIVRLKLLTCKFKKTTSIQMLIHLGNSSVTRNTIIRKNGVGEIALRTERTPLEVTNGVQQLDTNVNRHREVRPSRWLKFQALAKETLVESRECLKFENDDFIRRGHILNALPDPLLDVYQNYPSARELWKALEERFFTEDATSKKFIVFNFNLQYWKISYGNNLDKVHLSECGSEAASYELKGLALKHYEKPRYRPKVSFNESAQSGLNEREEGYA